MKITADGFVFDFTDALDVFIFDEKDKSSPHFHGLPMKAVDIIAEFQNAYIFVEIKNFHDPKKYENDEINSEIDLEMKEKKNPFQYLMHYLKYKYRDSYLFRYAEHKVDKPID